MSALLGEARVFDVVREKLEFAQEVAFWIFNDVPSETVNRGTVEDAATALTDIWESIDSDDSEIGRLMEEGKPEARAVMVKMDALLTDLTETYSEKLTRPWESIRVSEERDNLSMRNVYDLGRIVEIAEEFTIDSAETLVALDKLKAEYLDILNEPDSAKGLDTYSESRHPGEAVVTSWYQTVNRSGTEWHIQNNTYFAEEAIADIQAGLPFFAIVDDATNELVAVASYDITTSIPNDIVRFVSDETLARMSEYNKYIELRWLAEIGRGGGVAILKDIMQLAVVENAPVTVWASDMLGSFYKRNGFADEGNDRFIYYPR
jgi:hypothetical protein